LALDLANLPGQTRPMAMHAEPDALPLFVEWLRSEMESSGLKAGRLSRRIDVDESVVRRWLSGRTTPDLEHFYRLAGVFGLELPFYLEKRDTRVYLQGHPSLSVIEGEGRGGTVPTAALSVVPVR
jgi:ribosome-binding protein aMBF1 (putative translation factor)